MLSDRITRHVNLQNLIFLLSIFMFVWLCWYFYTGYGGPTELVAHLVPIALMLQILHMHKNGFIYKRLSPIANHHHRDPLPRDLSVTPSTIFTWNTRRSRSTGRDPIPGRTSSWGFWSSSW